MERIELKAQVRNGTGKGAARQLRRRGFIPGIFYGPGTEPINLAVGAAEFRKSLKGQISSNAVVSLLLEGSEAQASKVAMIVDVQMEPVSHDIMHVDFQEINLQKEVEVAVPVELVGKAAGVKDGGILQQIEREIEIRCLPLNIPERIEVDVTLLNVGDSIHIRDIAASEGIIILSPGEKTIATVALPAAEKVVAEAVVEGEEAAEGEAEKAAESEGE